MRYKKNSFEYEMNMEAFHEMDYTVPMTKPERNALRNWVKSGHDIETNPWNLRDSDGESMNYLQAHRLRFGYSCGPWDYWKGQDIPSHWGWHIEMLASDYYKYYK